MTFSTYPKIKQVGHEDNKDIFMNPEDDIVIEEKMDGANFRFIKSDGVVRFGSRTQELSEDKEHAYQKAFNRAINHVKQFADKIPEGYIFYGENMVRHTLDYQWTVIPPFLGFDIFSLSTDLFLPHETAKALFEDIGLDFVPVLGVYKCAEIKSINDDIVPISKYAPHKAEGVVFKNYTRGIFAKFVREEFKEKNAEVFGGASVKYAETVEAAFVAKYCTNGRIDKHIFKLVDEGHKLDLPMMATLPKRIWADIWSEEWQEIIQQKHQFKVMCPHCHMGTDIKPGINFDECRRMITRRCLAVLKQVMANSAMQEAIPVTE